MSSVSLGFVTGAAVRPSLVTRAPNVEPAQATPGCVAPIAGVPPSTAGNNAGAAAIVASLAGTSVAAAKRLRRKQRKQRGARVVVANQAANSSRPAPTFATKGTFAPRPTPLLDSLNDEGTQGMRRMDVAQLTDLAAEVRWQVLDAVSVSGGHLGAGLGVVELTVALHHVFDTPSDEICWDVAHQCQPHKVLTGRRSRIYSLRQRGGLSGFAKRKESEYDAFGAGHSSTSISAAVGFQEARKRLGGVGHSIAVIGDGAITGGMAWEAMNHAGGLRSKVLVILNDNGQVSLPTIYNSVEMPVGALSETLAGTQASDRGLKIQGDIAKLESSASFQRARSLAKSAANTLLPPQLSAAAAKLDEYTRDFVKTAPFQGSGAGSKGELFEQLGFYYIGPIDGHDMSTLVEVLSNIKKDHEDGTLEKPVFLHIKTQKGKGYMPAQVASDRLHAVKPAFNLSPEKEAPVGADPPVPPPPPLTKVFAEALIEEAKQDPAIVAITAAMPGGTGIGIFEKEFGPARTFDVGIAEQHAVTFAAGLAAGGLKPFCAIYSTFLQRGYDQVVHDVALQKLPVRFILDRAGLVGDDGATHGGTFDLSFLGCLPDLKICASADEAELVHMIHTLAMIDDGPTALRYPRGNAFGDLAMPTKPEFLEPGKGRVVREGMDNKLALLSCGGRLRECLKAAQQLEEEFGISATVADARWVKPLDVELVKQLATNHRVLITVEENSIGGFSAQVQQALLDAGMLDGCSSAPVILRSMTFPDFWIDHGTPQMQYEDAGLTAADIKQKSVELLQRAGVVSVVNSALRQKA